MPKVPPEAVFSSYALKSTFFYSKLQQLGYLEIYEKMRQLINDQGTAFDWPQRKDIGISDKAWDVVISAGIDPLLVFCNPKVLRLHPRFLRYYRSVAMIPMKGLKSISGFSGAEAAEEGKRPIADEKIKKVVESINHVCSFVIEVADGLTTEQVKAMIWATAGSSVEGSWRNAIGCEGERVVRSIILNNLFDNNEIKAVADKKDNSKAVTESTTVHELLEAVNDTKTITTVNDKTIFFSSEPDIELIDGSGNILGSVEIKAGIDPAGALERLGAMFKSFDNILSKYPTAKNILVAACITDEVQTRLNEAQNVHYKFILTDIINKNGDADIKFINRVRFILGLHKTQTM